MIGIIPTLQTATLTLFLAATPARSKAMPLQPNLVGLPVATMRSFACDFRVIFATDFTSDNLVSGACWTTQLVITADGSQQWVAVAGSQRIEKTPPRLPKITKTASPLADDHR